MVRKIAILSLCLLSLLKASASHIVGGEMTYKYLGNNRYQIKLSVFIDCFNGQAGAISQDATANIAVFDGNTRRILNNYPVVVNRQGPTRITKVNYNCIQAAPNACVDHYWYETTLTLAPRTGGYIISFQRCCRNNTITNLTSPEATGANYWTTIPDPRTTPDAKENSSAVFKELPPNFLCTNTLLKFNHSATDPDGDSLAYELFWPFRGGSQGNPRPDNGTGGTLQSPPFSNITWASGYDDQQPIDGNPPLTIDEETGYLTLIPTQIGQYVVGIKVKEYRKGVLISETKRDYQFNVAQCIIDMVAAYYAPKYICGYSYEFDNKSIGASRYHWDFGVVGTADTSNKFQPTFVFPKAGKYHVVLTTYKNNCVDSFVQDVIVLDPSKPKLQPDTILCPGRSASFTCDVFGDSYKWSTGATSRSISPSAEGLYWVTVFIKTCNWSDSVRITIDRDSIEGFGDTVYCTYDTFRRRLYATPGLFKYSWNTGSRLEQTTVNRSGGYVVSAVTRNNCPSSDTVFIEHYPPVEVVIPDTTVCPGNAVRFDAQNPGALVQWSSGDVGQTTDILAPGTYTVKVTIGKCRDLDTFIVDNFKNYFALGNDLQFCSRIDTLLSVAGQNLKSATWNNEVSGETYNLLKDGKLVVKVMNQYNCPESDSIYVMLFPNPGLDLGNDTTLCPSVNPILDAGANMAAYLWQDGKNERFHTALDQGLYWVEVKDFKGCRARDSVFIAKDPNLYSSMVFMPSAFTPDGNGINDWYPNNQFVAIGSLYEVKLYNRWGEKIAEYFSPNSNWDGTINGNPAPEGVYVYLATWIGCDNIRRSLIGDFHVLR